MGEQENRCVRLFFPMELDKGSSAQSEKGTGVEMTLILYDAEGTKYSQTDVHEVSTSILSEGLHTFKVFFFCQEDSPKGGKDTVQTGKKTMNLAAMARTEMEELNQWYKRSHLAHPFSCVIFFCLELNVSLNLHVLHSVYLNRFIPLSHCPSMGPMLLKKDLLMSNRSISKQLKEYNLLLLINIYRESTGRMKCSVKART